MTLMIRFFMELVFSFLVQTSDDLLLDDSKNKPHIVARQEVMPDRARHNIDKLISM